MSDSAIPWAAAHRASLSFSLTFGVCSFMSIKLVMLPDHLLLCHPLLLPSVFTATGSFSVSQLFASCAQTIGASASASVLPMNIQDWFPLGLTGLISLQSKGLSRVFSSTTIQKHQFLAAQLSLRVHVSHPYMTTGKTIALTIQSFVGKVMSLLFNMLSRFVIAFLPRIKRHLISWLQSPCAVILEPKNSPSICHEGMGPDAMILVFQMLNFKPAFSFSSFTLIKRLFSSSSLSAIGVVSSAYLRSLILSPVSWF